MWTPMMAAGEPPGGGRSFASRVRPDRAQRFVATGLVLFGAVGLLSWSVTQAVPLLPVLFAAFTIFHFWPALAASGPALQLEDRGIGVDGLGRVVWEGINKARIRHISRGPVKAHLLEIDLVLPASSMLTGQAAGLRRLQSRIGRVIGQQRLLIDLTDLEDPPEDVLAAMEYFLKRRVRGNVHS
jgi:hypothetical protein